MRISPAHSCLCDCGCEARTQLMVVLVKALADAERAKDEAEQLADDIHALLDSLGYEDDRAS